MNKIEALIIGLIVGALLGSLVCEKTVYERYKDYDKLKNKVAIYEGAIKDMKTAEQFWSDIDCPRINFYVKNGIFYTEYNMKGMANGK